MPSFLKILPLFLILLSPPALGKEAGLAKSLRQRLNQIFAPKQVSWQENLTVILNDLNQKSGGRGFEVMEKFKKAKLKNSDIKFLHERLVQKFGTDLNQCDLSNKTGCIQFYKQAFDTLVRIIEFYRLSDRSTIQMVDLALAKQLQWCVQQSREVQGPCIMAILNPGIIAADFLGWRSNFQKAIQRNKETVLRVVDASPVSGTFGLVLYDLWTNRLQRYTFTADRIKSGQTQVAFALPLMTLSMAVPERLGNCLGVEMAQFGFICDRLLAIANACPEMEEEGGMGGAGAGEQGGGMPSGPSTPGMGSGAAPGEEEEKQRGCGSDSGGGAGGGGMGGLDKCMMSVLGFPAGDQFTECLVNEARARRPGAPNLADNQINWGMVDQFCGLSDPPEGGECTGTCADAQQAGQDIVNSEEATETLGQACVEGTDGSHCTADDIADAQDDAVNDTNTGVVQNLGGACEGPDPGTCGGGSYTWTEGRTQAYEYGHTLVGWIFGVESNRIQVTEGAAGNPTVWGHEYMHAAMNNLGVPSDLHHGYMGSTTSESEETFSRWGGSGMPGPDSVGTGCSAGADRTASASGCLGGATGPTGGGGGPITEPASTREASGGSEMPLPDGTPPAGGAPVCEGITTSTTRLWGSSGGPGTLDCDMFAMRDGCLQVGAPR
ncbi:MAG: hypothetical protein HY609_01775 [Deltaproteobacteria bacterium]|nr:hypothetical protein [Deltaproteobacteria bacterium]